MAVLVLLLTIALVYPSGSRPAPKEDYSAENSGLNGSSVTPYLQEDSQDDYSLRFSMKNFKSKFSEFMDKAKDKIVKFSKIIIEKVKGVRKGLGKMEDKIGIKWKIVLCVLVILVMYNLISCIISYLPIGPLMCICDCLCSMFSCVFGCCGCTAESCLGGDGSDAGGDSDSDECEDKKQKKKSRKKRGRKRKKRSRRYSDS